MTMPYFSKQIYLVVTKKIHMINEKKKRMSYIKHQKSKKWRKRDKMGEMGKVWKVGKSTK